MPGERTLWPFYHVPVTSDALWFHRHRTREISSVYILLPSKDSSSSCCPGSNNWIVLYKSSQWSKQWRTTSYYSSLNDGQHRLKLHLHTPRLALLLTLVNITITRIIVIVSVMLVSLLHQLSRPHLVVPEEVSASPPLLLNNSRLLPLSYHRRRWW